MARPFRILEIIMSGRFLRGIGVLEDWDLGCQAPCFVGGEGSGHLCSWEGRFQLSGLALLAEERGRRKFLSKSRRGDLRGDSEKGTREDWHDNQRGV